MCQVFPKLKGDAPLKTYMESVMEKKKEFLDQLDSTKERCPPCSKNKIYLFLKFKSEVRRKKVKGTVNVI